MNRPKRNNSNYYSKKTQNNKRIKLQSLGNNLKNTIDSLLNEAQAQEKLDHLILNQQYSSNPNSDLPIIVPKINPDNLPKVDAEKTNKMNQENENVKYNNKNKLNLKNIEKNLKTVKKKIKKLQKSSFMTGVGLTKNKKEPIVVKKLENDPMLNDINNQINAILKNIDDEGDEQKVRKTIKHLKDSADFKEMIKEIDDYRDEIHEEFDEVKYLIKFADNTHKLIDRHKNVMTNIFRGAGLRPTKNLENEEERAKINKGNKKYSSKSTGKYEIDNYKNYNDYNDYDNEPYYKDGYYYRQAREEDMNLGEVFDKLKAINKVKDNLSNIQDDFLGYHQNLKTKMKRINGGK
jgi:hypothetical protein